MKEAVHHLPSSKALDSGKATIIIKRSDLCLRAQLSLLSFWLEHFWMFGHESRVVTNIIECSFGYEVQSTSTDLYQAPRGAQAVKTGGDLLL
jgi:hypothetical protein